MIVQLLTEHHLKFLSLKAGCRGSSESTLSKCQIVGNLMPRLIYLERSSFCLSTDVNFTSLALSSVKIYSFE